MTDLREYINSLGTSCFRGVSWAIALYKLQPFFLFWENFEELSVAISSICSR